jgi:RimJ/RimL family protein N-acetyltransferase
MMAETPRLESARLVLRPVTASDVNPRYCAWLNDPAVNRHLETRFQTQTIETVARYVATISSDPAQFFWAICRAEDGVHIGNIKLGPVHEVHRTGDVSLFIGEKNAWRRGYAAEAIALVCACAFGTLGVNKLKAGFYVGNAGSIRAFEKCGFRKEGRLREHAFSEGHFTDVILMGRLASDPPPAP